MQQRADQMSREACKAEFEAMLSQYGWNEVLTFLRRGKANVQYQRVHGKERRAMMAEVWKRYKAGELSEGGTRVDMTETEETEA